MESVRNDRHHKAGLLLLVWCLSILPATKSKAEDAPPKRRTFVVLPAEGNKPAAMLGSIAVNIYPPKTDSEQLLTKINPKSPDARMTPENVIVLYYAAASRGDAAAMADLFIEKQRQHIAKELASEPSLSSFRSTTLFQKAAYGQVVEITNEPSIRIDSQKNGVKASIQPSGLRLNAYLVFDGHEYSMFQYEPDDIGGKIFEALNSNFDAISNTVPDLSITDEYTKLTYEAGALRQISATNPVLSLRKDTPVALYVVTEPIKNGPRLTFLNHVVHTLRDGNDNDFRSLFDRESQTDVDQILQAVNDREELTELRQRFRNGAIQTAFFIPGAQIQYIIYSFSVRGGDTTREESNKAKTENNIGIFRCKMSGSDGHLTTIQPDASLIAELLLGEKNDPNKIMQPSDIAGQLFNAASAKYKSFLTMGQRDWVCELISPNHELLLQAACFFHPVCSGCSMFCTTGTRKGDIHLLCPCSRETGTFVSESKSKVDVTFSESPKSKVDVTFSESKVKGGCHLFRIPSWNNERHWQRARFGVVLGNRSSQQSGNPSGCFRAAGRGTAYRRGGHRPSPRSPIPWSIVICRDGGTAEQ